MALQGHSSSASYAPPHHWTHPSKKINAPPVISQSLTTMSWHQPAAVGSCRRGRRLPAADVARHRLAFSGQACCPWSAASPPHSRRWAKCSAVEIWAKNKNKEASCSVLPGVWVWTQNPTHVCSVFLSQFSLSPLVFLLCTFLPHNYKYKTAIKIR